MKAAAQVIMAGVLGSINGTAATVFALLLGVALIIEATAKWRAAGGPYYSGLADHEAAQASRARDARSNERRLVNPHFNETTV